MVTERCAPESLNLIDNPLTERLKLTKGRRQKGGRNIEDSCRLLSVDSGLRRFNRGGEWGAMEYLETGQVRRLGRPLRGSFPSRAHLSLLLLAAVGAVDLAVVMMRRPLLMLGR